MRYVVNSGAEGVAAHVAADRGNSHLGVAAVDMDMLVGRSHTTVVAVNIARNTAVSSDMCCDTSTALLTTYRIPRL